MKILVFFILMKMIDANPGASECEKWKSTISNKAKQLSTLGYGIVDLEKTFVLRSVGDSSKVSYLTINGKIKIPISYKLKDIDIELNSKKVLTIDDMLKVTFSKYHTNLYETQKLPEELSFISYPNDEVEELSSYDYTSNMMSYGLSEIACTKNNGWKKYILPFLTKASLINETENWFRSEFKNFNSVLIIRNSRQMSISIYQDNLEYYVDFEYSYDLENDELESIISASGKEDILILSDQEI